MSHDLEKVFSLSPRLTAVLGFIPDRGTVADVGTDHGYLAASLALARPARRVIATDRSPEALGVARRTMARIGGGSVELRLGDGLAPLGAGEVETVVIAGVGGDTIREVLTRGRDRLTGVRRLVLQPARNVEDLRRWLGRNRWHRHEEALVFEEDRPYWILAVERDGAWGVDVSAYEEIDWWLGGPVRRRPDPELTRYLAAHQSRLERYVSHLAGTDARQRERRIELTRWLEMIREERRRLDGFVKQEA